VDAGEVLRKWETEHAPVFRELAPELAARGRTGYFEELDSLPAVSRRCIHVGTPAELAAIRTTVRALLIDLGVPLATLSAADASVCGLHGSTCRMA